MTPLRFDVIRIPDRSVHRFRRASRNGYPAAGIHDDQMAESCLNRIVSVRGTTSSADALKTAPIHGPPVCTADRDCCGTPARLTLSRTQSTVSPFSERTKRCYPLFFVCRTLSAHLKCGSVCHDRTGRCCMNWLRVFLLALNSTSSGLKSRQTGWVGSRKLWVISLLLQFSVLEIDPSNPKEQFLARLLTGFQAEAAASGEPRIAPRLRVIPATGFTPVVQRLFALLLLNKYPYFRVAHPGAPGLNHRDESGGD